MLLSRKQTAVVTLLAFLLLAQGPQHSSGQQTTTPALLTRLSALESSISTAWRNSDRTNFQQDTNEALGIIIPKALLEIAEAARSGLDKLPILGPVFSILSTIVDVIGQVAFSRDKTFADLYVFLQENFDKVNAMIESNFHAIQDLQSIVLCGQAYGEVKTYKTQINAFYGRFVEMMKRAKTDPKAAALFVDAELTQYQSTKMMLGIHQLLKDKTLYASIVTDCASGGVLAYTQRTLELFHAFEQAIILDSVAKTRLFNFTKQALAQERTYWREQVDQVVFLMSETGADLVSRSWYAFYKNDVDKSLSGTAHDSASNAAGVLNAVLTPKYPYVRTAVIIVPSDTQSISVTDAFGANMTKVDQDSFVCYRSRRANGDSVIVLCRNQASYPNEQQQLNTAYATYSQGVLTLSLVDALKNSRCHDIATIMARNKVSFFAVKVRLRSGSVSAAQSQAAKDLVFFQSDGTAFQALVIAKLITLRAPPRSGSVPCLVSSAPGVRSEWRLVAAALVVPLACILRFESFGF